MATLRDTTLVNALQHAQSLSSIDLAACKTTWHGTHYLFNWYRLAPHSTELEPLGTWNDGSYDALDASKERAEQWPTAHDVTYFALTQELAHRTGATHAVRCYATKECDKIAYAICVNCEKPVCYLHYMPGDFEEWCLTCGYEYIDMLRIDGDISTEDYLKYKRGAPALLEE